MSISTALVDSALPAASTTTASSRLRIPRRIGLLVLGLFLIASPLFASEGGVGHTLDVDIRPADGELQVVDRLRFDQPVRRVEFTLNAGFSVSSADATVRRLGESTDGLRARYTATLQTAGDSFQLQYHGQPRFSGARGHGGMPSGTLSERGVYLDGASAWYPQLDVDIAALELRVRLPAGWQSVSLGGRRIDGETQIWTTGRPHDDIYLIADRFTRHVRRHGDIDLSVYLLDDDPALAARYLDAIGGYIDHYSELIGAYPYAKFAVVENRWQTGYGMPSFTLLGSRVMRLPFILYTSLPHEILHNWWGNGVWIDYAGGNWSEGLTAYLADHWMQERRGKGAGYRLKALQRYSNFAARGADAPLLAFVSRHSDASQSLGYSKSLMLFHMLRSALGDDAFVEGLRRLWREHAYQRVGFARVLRTLAGDDTATADRFVAWLETTGAPNLDLREAEVTAHDDGWSLHFTLTQNQADAWTLDVPVAITLAGQARSEIRHLRLNGHEQRFDLRFTRRPLRIDIDPQYDLMRVLDVTEQPPALNRLFGSRKAWLVTPDAASGDVREAWHALAAAWSRRYPGLEVISDTRAAHLAADADYLLLGWNNSLLAEQRGRFSRPDQDLGEQDVRVADATYTRDATAVVLVDSDANGVTRGFIGAPGAATIRQLARKLPHYGSYGRLVFDAGGDNLRKDTLSSAHSRLTRQLGSGHTDLALARPAPLAAAASHDQDKPRR